MKYTTAHINAEDVQSIEFMIRQFQEKDKKVTRQSFVTWCVRNTVKCLFDEIDKETTRLENATREARANGQEDSPIIQDNTGYDLEGPPSGAGEGDGHLA